MVNFLSVIAILATSSTLAAAVPDKFADIMGMRREIWEVVKETSSIAGETQNYLNQANGAVHDAQRSVEHAKKLAGQAKQELDRVNRDIKNMESNISKSVKNLSGKQFVNLIKNLDKARRNVFNAMGEKQRADYRVSRANLDETETRDHVKALTIARNSALGAIKGLNDVAHRAFSTFDVNASRDMLKKAQKFRKDAIRFANLAKDQRNRAQRAAKQAYYHADKRNAAPPKKPESPKVVFVSNNKPVASTTTTVVVPKLTVAPVVVPIANVAPVVTITITTTTTTTSVAVATNTPTVASPSDFSSLYGQASSQAPIAPPAFDFNAVSPPPTDLGSSSIPPSNSAPPLDFNAFTPSATNAAPIYDPSANAAPMNAAGNPNIPPSAFPFDPTPPF